jgi:hypothetical protein
MKSAERALSQHCILMNFWYYTLQLMNLWGYNTEPSENKLNQMRILYVGIFVHVEFPCNLEAWWLSAIAGLSYIAHIYIKGSRCTSK